MSDEPLQSGHAWLVTHQHRLEESSVETLHILESSLLHQPLHVRDRDRQVARRQQTRVGAVAGCMVVNGLIKRTARARLIRDSVVSWEGNIASLRRFKEDVSEVREGYECGIGLENFNDMKVGDQIEAYIVEKVAATEL